jgi:hypothetical protein
MLRLLANDFRLNAVFVFWVFLLFNVQLVLMAWLAMTGRHVVGGIQSGIVFASAIAVAVFLREEQNKGQIIIRSLPISHSKVVCARYLSISLFVIAGAVYGLFFWLIVAQSIRNAYMHEDFLRLLGDWYAGMKYSWITLALVAAATVAIAVPLIVRYGTFWRILFGYLIVMIGWSRTITYLQYWSLGLRIHLGLTRWILLVLVLIIAMETFSIWLSVRLYSRREL